VHFSPNKRSFSNISGYGTGLILKTRKIRNNN
jgi:hypothetical protein